METIALQGQWEAHFGEDYTVVMLPNEVTDTASIRIYGENAPAIAAVVAVAPDALALLKELIDIEGPQPETSDWAAKVQAVLARSHDIYCDRCADAEADEAEAATQEQAARRICHCTDGFHEPQPGCGDCGGTGFRPVEE